MKHRAQDEERTYRTVSLALLGAAFLCCLAILIAHLSGRQVCVLQNRLGRPCLLCGCTRDFMAILTGHAPTYNPLSGWFFGLTVLELLWRFAGVWIRWGRRVAITDIAAHAVLILTVLYFNFKVIFTGGA